MMRIKIYLLLLLLVSGANIHASQINTVVFLGDSLSDSGNLYHTYHIPRPPYKDGRFSNGPVWSELVGAHFKAQLNYAVGGTTITSLGCWNHFHHEFSQEIRDCFSNYPNLNGNQTLYVIWIGANDYTTHLVNRGESDFKTEQVLTGIMNSIDDIARNHGGKYFMLFNLPDFSKLPFAKMRSDQQTLHELVLLHNQKLLKKIMQEIANLQASHITIHIIAHDIFTDFEELLSNPIEVSMRYNEHIENATDPCWQYSYILKQDVSGYEIDMPVATNIQASFTAVPENHSCNLAPTISPDIAEALQTNQLFQLFGNHIACKTPDSYLFWDHIHPSAATHRIIASIAEKVLIDEKMIDSPKPFTG